MNASFLSLLYVALGGAVGAVLRYLSGVAALRLFGAAFPYGTLLVNIVGSLAMGLVIAFLSKRVNASDELRLFLATGLLGGFTTFSAFSLDFAELWQRGEIRLALAYAVLSVLLSIGAVFSGLAIGQFFARG